MTELTSLIQEYKQLASFFMNSKLTQADKQSAVKSLELLEDKIKSLIAK